MALLENITYSPGEPMQSAFDKINAAIDALNSITDGNELAQKKIDIGDWDIPSGSVKNVAHGLDYTKILSVDVIIRNDTDTSRFPLFSPVNVGFDNDAKVSFTSTNIVLTAKGFFSSTAFDSTSYNRGFILISYLK